MLARRHAEEFVSLIVCVLAVLLLVVVDPKLKPIGISTWTEKPLIVGFKHAFSHEILHMIEKLVWVLAF